MKVLSTIIDPILNLQGTHEEFRAIKYMTVASGLPGAERASTLLVSKLSDHATFLIVCKHNSDINSQAAFVDPCSKGGFITIFDYLYIPPTKIKSKIYT